MSAMMFLLGGRESCERGHEHDQLTHSLLHDLLDRCARLNRDRELGVADRRQHQLSPLVQFCTSLRARAQCRERVGHQRFGSTLDARSTLGRGEFGAGLLKVVDHAAGNAAKVIVELGHGYLALKESSACVMRSAHASYASRRSWLSMRSTNGVNAS